MADDIEAILRSAAGTDAARADAWDAFHQSATADEFAAKVKGLSIPDSVKADLWDLKSSTKGQTATTAPNASPGSNAGLGMVAAAKAIPAAAAGAMELATNPAVPQAAAAIGRTAGAIIPTAGELLAGNPAAAIAAAAAASKTSWAGGGAGWGLGKLAQKAAAPLGAGNLGPAAALAKIAPYAQTLGTLGGAQNVLGLAQMADPDRQDIGTLGVGPSVKAGAIPMTPELVKMPVADAVKSLTDAGWPEARAKSYVTQMRKLMSR